MQMATTATIPLTSMSIWPKQNNNFQNVKQQQQQQPSIQNEFNDKYNVHNSLHLIPTTTSLLSTTTTTNLMKQQNITNLSDNQNHHTMKATDLQIKRNNDNDYKQQQQQQQQQQQHRQKQHRLSSTGLNTNLIIQQQQQQLQPSTKFITNTKTITVTQTQTTLLYNSGITTTMTIVLTTTSTIIERFTHEVTHTKLIEPIITATTTTAAAAATTLLFASTPPSIENIRPSTTTIQSNDINELIDLNELIINYDENIHSSTPYLTTTTTTTKINDDMDNIFVVMQNDQSKYINMNTLNRKQTNEYDIRNGVGNGDGVTNENTNTNTNTNTNEIAIRDEDDLSNEVNHVLLGGVLIASPPHIDKRKHFNQQQHVNIDNDIDHNNMIITTTNDIYRKQQKQNDINVDDDDNGVDIDLIKQLCQPECKSQRNELCQSINGHGYHCVCRPGFARMFPDQPCKPTYTYTLKLPLQRYNNEYLYYDMVIENRSISSPKYQHLTELTYNSLDRMLMQSDLRDIYQGIYLLGFSNGTTAAAAAATTTTTIDSNNSISNNSNHMEMNSIENVIAIDFYLQLSDSIDENRIIDVLQKYLRNNNYSLGGTELFTSNQLINDIRATDFDECANREFHDCSENAQCFNLRGTYTCSCRDGYIDLSENHIYPGRLCSSELIGCDLCNYHGTCIDASPSDDLKCECFQWYAGKNCEINLKAFLIGLSTLGLILFALLIIYAILMYLKRHRSIDKQLNSNIIDSGHKSINDKRLFLATTTTTVPTSRSNIGPKRNQPFHSRLINLDTKNGNKALDKCAMLSQSSDKCSEISDESNTLPPYVTKNRQNNDVTINQVENVREQSERSMLTVMIPRAKYHSTRFNQQQKHIRYGHDNNDDEDDDDNVHYDDDDDNDVAVDNIDSQSNQMDQRSNGGATSICTSITQAKLLSYLDVNSAANNNGKRDGTQNKSNVKCRNGNGIKQQQQQQQQQQMMNYNGALVSAGFEVSATVQTEHPIKATTTTTPSIFDQQHSNIIHQNEQFYHVKNHYRKNGDNDDDDDDVTAAGDDDDDDNVNWLHKAPSTELIVSEARSYDETMVHPTTKSFTYDKQSSHYNTDEANTMAERDLGSTFLLPHTHLYKPDREESNIFGFDSL